MMLQTFLEWEIYEMSYSLLMNDSIQCNIKVIHQYEPNLLSHMNKLDLNYFDSNPILNLIMMNRSMWIC